MWIWLSTSSQRVLYTISRISMICGSCWACMCVVDWRIQSVCSLDVSISYTWPTEQLADCYSDSTYTLSSHLNHHDTLPANIIDMVIGILATQHGLSSVDTLWGMVSMEGICMWGWVRVLSGEDEIWVARLDSHESDVRSASFIPVSDPMLCRYYWWCNCDMLQYTVAVNWNMHYQHRAVDFSHTSAMVTFLISSLLIFPTILLPWHPRNNHHSGSSSACKYSTASPRIVAMELFHHIPSRGAGQLALCEPVGRKGEEHQPGR